MAQMALGSLLNETPAPEVTREKQEESMQKLYEVTVIRSSLKGVADGVYSVNIFPGGNLLRTCQKVLYGCSPNGKYRYALFKNDYGWIIRRKLRYISEQEQSWEDVAEVVKIH